MTRYLDFLKKALVEKRLITKVNIRSAVLAFGHTDDA
jgi:hypothetical protein